MSMRTARLPASLGEFAVLLMLLIGMVVTVAGIASGVLWVIQTIAGIPPETVIWALFGGWLVFGAGVLVGGRLERMEETQ